MATAAPPNGAIKLTPSEASSALTSFSKILQFPTVSATAASTGAYNRCASYLHSRLSSIPCLDQIHFLPESPKDSPVVVARWKGSDESLGIILLNSHYDVVPAVRQDWIVPPFDGLRKDGRVYGRGAQDMKCVCIQYIEAIRKLHSMKPDFVPKRSVYLTFVPDEEVGGSGMAAFLSSKLYQSLSDTNKSNNGGNGGIALALDEGLASTDDTYSVFYGERLPWWVDVTATGNTGHGSRFIEHTAVEQLIKLANKALEFREGQRKALHGDGSNGNTNAADHCNCAHAVAAKKRRLNKLKSDPNSKMTLGDVTTLNITTIQAGVKAGNDFVYNCVPPVAKCSMDIRISPHVDPAEIKDMLDGWCQECSASPDDVPCIQNGESQQQQQQQQHKLTWEYVEGCGSKEDLQKHALTSTDVKVNPWYGIFGSTLESMGYKYQPEVFPAATDSRFLRVLGIRALGFSPMRNSEILLHENDEYLADDVFLEGVGVYVGLIEALASQDKEL